VQSQRFESVVPGVIAKPGPVGVALNQAANDVAAQIAEWVG
jgi:cholesterol transport system auxiliary component